ncbi:MAG: xyloglucanase [Myxococcales bacterium]|nr:xyloglucanase [Myxococcales bacterium]
MNPVRRFSRHAPALMALVGCVTTRLPNPAGADAGPGGDGVNAGPPQTVEPNSCASIDAPVSGMRDPFIPDSPPSGSGPYTWRNVAVVGGGFVTGIVFSRAAPNIVYARTDIGGAYRWDETTGRWMPMLDWVSRDQSNWGGVESIAADPHDASVVYVAAGTYVTSGKGVFLRSNDQGRTFQTIVTQIPMGSNNDGRSVGERLVVDPNDPSTLYFGSRTTGLWKSTDAAATWTNVATFPGPATTPNGVGVPFVTFDPRSCVAGGPSTVYVASAVDGTSIYRSNDGGATWTAVPGQPTGLLPSRGVISPNGVLYVTYGGGTLSDGGTGGTNGDGPNNVTRGAVYRLDVRAGSWGDVTPARGAFGYAGVSVDGSHPETVVVSTLDHWGRDDIYRTTNGGESWTEVGVPGAPHDASAAPWVTFHMTAPNYTGWMGDVEIDPFDRNRVLHTTGQGIWASEDIAAVDSSPRGTTHWAFRSVGIEETAVNDLASPPSGPPLLSAVGDIGGFRHDDLGVSPAGGMSSNPTFSTTDSIDFAELKPSVVARVGRGSASHGAFSTDGGASWQPFVNQLPISSSSAGIVAVSADGSTLVWYVPAATVTSMGASTSSPAGPRVSSDFGMTGWQPSTGVGVVGSLVADRVDPTRFYALEASTGRVLVSLDRGATFSVGATGFPTRGGGRLRATPGVTGDLWLYTGRNLYHSTDGATTFATVPGPSGVFAFGLGMSPPGMNYPALYLGGTVAEHTGIFRSDDQGTTFIPIDDPQHRFATAAVVVGDPRVYGRVYVGNNGRGIFYGEPTP